MLGAPIALEGDCVGGTDSFGGRFRDVKYLNAHNPGVCKIISVM